MSTYVLIESRDPFNSDQVAANCKLAADLRHRGHVAVLYLIENGVLAARQAARHSLLSEAMAAGVQVLADDFSLRERGIAPSELHSHIRSAPLDVIVDYLEQGSRIFWH